jgi:hypothetical protein
MPFIPSCETYKNNNIFLKIRRVTMGVVDG